MTLDLNCVPINGTVFRLLGPVTLAPDQRHHQIDSVCLSSVARYEIVMEYNTFTAAINWLLDSVSESSSYRGKNHKCHKTQSALENKENVVHMAISSFTAAPSPRL